MRAILLIFGWVTLALGAVLLMDGFAESSSNSISLASALLPTGAFLLIVAKLFTYLEALLENLNETKELQRRQLTRLTLNSSLLKIIVRQNHPREYAQMVLDDDQFSEEAKSWAKQVLQEER